MESSSDFKNTNLTLLDLNIPREVLEIILAYCFRPFLLEDQLIRDQIISKFFDEPHLQDPEMDSVFVRQKQIYQFASSLLTVCRAFYVALRNSNVIWEKIFRLTLGASSWLAKTPAIIQTEFRANYYQACRYLMTFGKQIETADFEQLDPELICIGVGTSFVLFQQDEKVVRYDLISRSFVPLRSVQLQTDWQTIFMQRFIAEKSLYRRYKQYLAQHDDTTQNQPQNDTTDGIVELHVVERTIGDLLVFARDPTLTPSTEYWSEIAASLDVFGKFLTFESEAIRLEVTVAAIARLLRLDWNNSIQSVDFSERLLSCLHALDKYLKPLDESEKECIGLMSMLCNIIDTTYRPDVIGAAVTMFNYLVECSRSNESPDYILMADNLRVVPRTLEIYEKISDSALDLVVLNTLRFLLRKHCKDSAQLIRRPEFIKKLKKVTTGSGDKLSKPTFNSVISVIANIASIDPDYVASHGFLDVLIDVAYSFEGVDKWLFADVFLGIKRFCHSKTLRVKIATNSTLLNHLMSLFHRHAKNPKFQFSDCLPFFTFFRFLCANQQSLSYFFGAGYLDELLPYIPKITSKVIFVEMGDIMGYYIRYVRLEYVHKKLEPHLQTIIRHKFINLSVPFWQDYYCGMPMPREITKSLVERIIPELPLEADLDHARSYAELLANIVQSDRAVLLEVDVQPVFEHLALKLILDEDREVDMNNRGRVPYPICFLSAAVCLPQAAQLAIKNDALLDKMNSLYTDEEENETIYMVTHFYSHLVKLEGWNNTKGLKILARFGGTMPLDADMYFLFTFIEPYSHLFLRDNPVEMVLFGSWMVARMSQRKEGRLGLKKLSTDVIEWLTGHSDMRIRKNMNHYHQNMEHAKKLYDI